MRLFAASLLLCLAACTQFPQLDNWDPSDASAPYPDLLPLSALLGPEAEVTQPELRGPIEARLYRLRQRAADLRGQVVSAPTKRRMRQAITSGG
ncbi:MAG: hypothetical protein MK160_11295 [Rhodobacteraceae bacterium]|nr:hypothetical protein [Paracoccaceae bacterium]